MSENEIAKAGSPGFVFEPQGWISEPQGFVFDSLPLNMNWDLSGQEIGSWDCIFRGQKMRGLESRLTWIGYQLKPFGATPESWWCFLTGFLR